MIKLKDLLIEASNTKKGFEVIRTLTHGHPLKFGRMTKAKWVQHQATGIIFGGGKYKGGNTGAQIFTQGGDKYRVEILKAISPKPRITKKIKNVEGDMLYSTLKQHLGI